MEDEEPERLDLVLSTHFVTKFLLDVIQFSSAFYIRCEYQQHTLPDKRSLYDHRKPLDLTQDLSHTAHILKFTYTSHLFEEIIGVSV